MTSEGVTVNESCCKSVSRISKQTITAVIKHYITSHERDKEEERFKEVSKEYRMSKSCFTRCRTLKTEDGGPPIYTAGERIS